MEPGLFMVSHNVCSHGNYGRLQPCFGISFTVYTTHTQTMQILLLPLSGHTAPGKARLLVH